ncbi:MAG: hypothetical protein PHW42_00235 [Patescibacteria group bacterium]|nr:hypothetical protein [Patescibacteria group bacterium]MDD4694867.1 hypothetical protein [Patescibacteria group bacterium]
MNIFNKYNGKYLIFHKGKLKFLEGSNIKNNMLPCRYSVLSPGTERWHMKSSKNGNDIVAGYINISQVDNSYIISPAPHGAYFTPEPDMLRAPNSTPICNLVIARFQLMFASVFDFKLSNQDRNNIIVIRGSGPVAHGVLFELIRRGFKNIIILTSKKWNKKLLSLAKATKDKSILMSADLIIECTGNIKSILEILKNSKNGSSIALVGSPREICNYNFYEIHYKDLSIFGMREIFEPFNVRQKIFSDILLWLSKRDLEFSELCEIYPASKVIDVYKDVIHCLYKKPFIIIDWQ